MNKNKFMENQKSIKHNKYKKWLIIISNNQRIVNLVIYYYIRRRMIK